MWKYKLAGSELFKIKVISAVNNKLLMTYHLQPHYNHLIYSSQQHLEVGSVIIVCLPNEETEAERS